MGALLSGFVSAAGNKFAQVQDDKRQQTQADINSQRELKYNQLHQQRQQIQDNLAKMAPDDPNRDMLQQQLGKINSDQLDLFHPDKDPGALQHLGQLISQHVFGHKPAPTPSVQAPATPDVSLGGQVIPGAASPGTVQGPSPIKTPEDARQVWNERMATYQMAANTAPAGALTSDEQHEAERVKSGLDPKAVAAKDVPVKPVFKMLKTPDGNVGWYDVAHPDNIPEGAVAVQTSGQMKNRAVWAKDPKTGKPYSVELDSNNQPVPGSENYDAIPPIGMLPSLHTGQYTWTDADGNVHQTPTTSSNQKDLSGVGGGPSRGGGTSSSKAAGSPSSTPKTPGALRAKAKAASGAGGETVKGDKVIGYKGSGAFKDLTKQVGKENSNLTSANSNLALMTKSADAAKRGDGPAQVAIVSGYLKGVVGGAGTGVRITKPEWDAAVQTRPFLQGIEAHFTPDGYMSKATLAPAQVDQMIQEMGVKKQTLEQSVASLKQQVEDQKASDTGKKPAAAAAPKQYKMYARGPGGHRIGSDDGNNWFDETTGAAIK